VALTYLRKWEDAISTFKETDGHYKKTISNIAAKGQEFEEQLRSGAISESEYDHKIEQLLFAENGRWWNEKVLS
jgi:hypothetical protein